MKKLVAVLALSMPLAALAADDCDQLIMGKVDASRTVQVECTLDPAGRPVRVIVLNRLSPMGMGLVRTGEVPFAQACSWEKGDATLSCPADRPSPLAGTRYGKTGERVPYCMIAYACVEGCDRDRPARLLVGPWSCYGNAPL